MIQGRGHLEEERLRCHCGCQSADPCRRTAVNRREEKRGMVGCFREKEEEVVSSVESFASPFHRSKEIKVRFQITNKTFETISFDKIGITITGKDGNGKNSSE